jgi:hypothetical protein
VFTVKFRQANCGGSFNDTERDSLVAQSDDAQRRLRGEPDEVSRVDLNLETAIVICSDGVALDERIVQPEWFPILVAVTFQVNLAADQADADDARFYVVVVVSIIVIVGAGDFWNGEESE